MKRPSNLLSPVLAILTACAAPVAVMAADDPQPPQSAGQAASQSAPRMITYNPDGTFTVQKAPATAAKDPKAKAGLVIPPQVVVPFVTTPEKRK